MSITRALARSNRSTEPTTKSISHVSPNGGCASLHPPLSTTRFKNLIQGFTAKSKGGFLYFPFQRRDIACPPTKGIFFSTSCQKGLYLRPLPKLIVPTFLPNTTKNVCYITLHEGMRSRLYRRTHREDIKGTIGAARYFAGKTVCNGASAA
ncbi:MAG: hypothetical protein BROFUL_00365 [Candidatus Brocadia fulgida]|uniref:Uncharacterized protein n=1 Tax=Candidatus Brocadia fulgida TaxID=380242 RepID=A0A0M2UZ33_9BACT|nr:MAG: hypothetical protein BROFUL_00365 [Candidatus Brocadia fulgida]